ncbi:MAG: type II secretion system minor pseudopilin GspH [Gammaproteobacteria bacterium]|nr:type II secretion system minor pseudopilin GspH [Gammaproteobacteria bacterium]
MPSNFSLHHVRGFTLVEILVVLFIVSIMTGMVVINLPRFTQTGDFDTEANRLKVVLEMLREEALTQANEYGLRPERRGYQFYIYNERQQVWELLQEQPFAARKLPAGVHLSVRVEGNELQFGEEDAPPILILSSGEITPFELNIESDMDDDLLRTLESDGYGAIVWQGEDER